MAAGNTTAIARAARYKEEADNIAKSNGGSCLSERVLTLNSPVLLKCKIHAHPPWRSRLSLLRGSKGRKPSWCKRCSCAKAGVNRRTSEKTLQDWAARFGGKLRNKAPRVTDCSKWECGACGVFDRAFVNMQTTGTFCPNCSVGLAERLCKRAVEQLFGREFTEKRFQDLRGIGGKPLQIDLYCDALKLGVEHHGSQHFSPKKFWGQWRFKRQQEHDRRRREYCQQRGITLIELRQVGEITKLEDIKAIIRRECETANVPIPVGYDETKIDFQLHTLKPKQQMMSERLERLVAELGWQKRTRGYLGVVVKHDFVCDNSHPVSKTPSSLFGGEGCKECEKRPVIVEGIGVFSSVSEAAKSLTRSISATHRAAASKGACAGHRVRFLSWEEHKQLSNSAKPQAGYWDRIPVKRVRPRKSSFGVLLADGRIFQIGADASRELGVAAETLYNAIRRGGTCHGLGLRKLTVMELASALADKTQLSRLLATIPNRIPHAKPNRRLVVTSLGEVFESILAVSRALEVHTSSIHSALIGRHRCQGRYLLAVCPSLENELAHNPARVTELFRKTLPRTKR